MRSDAIQTSEQEVFALWEALQQDHALAFQPFRSQVYVWTYSTPLAYFSIRNASFEIIQATGNMNPAAARVRAFLTDDTSPLPLQSAARHCSDVRVLEFLHALNPAAVEQEGPSGEYPLHDACYSLYHYKQPISADVIRFLVNQFPAALDAKSRCGGYPFHLAVRAGAPLEVLKYLGDHRPQQFDSHLFPACCVKASSLEALHYIADKCKTDCCNAASFDFICSNEHASLDMIQFVTAKITDAIITQDSKREAIKYQAKHGSPESVRWLLQHYPPALQHLDHDCLEEEIKTKACTTPLHLALQCQPNCRLMEMVKLLVEYDSSQLQRKCCYYHLLPCEVPLAAVQAGACWEKLKAVTEYLIEKTAKDYALKNPGMPLHAVVQYSDQLQLDQASVEYMTTVLYKEELDQEDSEGNLPLHLAVANGCGLLAENLVDVVLKGNPDACNRANKKGFLPLHVASASVKPLECYSKPVMRQERVYRWHDVSDCEWRMKKQQMLFDLCKSHPPAVYNVQRR